MATTARPAQSAYDGFAQALHWGMAVLVLGLFAVGLWMVDLPAIHKLKWVPLHKSFGTAVLLLAAVRLGWRLAHPAPALPGTMPRWEQRAAHAAHYALYALLFAVPISGWCMSSALGVATVPFGLFELPNLLERDRALGESLKGVHFALNKLLLALIVLHAAAALKHLWVDRDGVFQRMLPALVIALLFGAAALPAAGQVRTIDTARSRIAFTYTVDRKIAVEGRFPRFAGDIRFDEKQPEQGSVRFEIDIAAIDTGTTDGDREARHALWFDTAKFPKATFASTALKRTGERRYEAAGTLAIKGKTQPLAIAFTLEPDGTATGSFTVKRLAFGVGLEQWADVAQIADEVGVKFRLVLK
ncbi:MAG: YceI family protein [Burkholderiales bacterium]|nr:YceI family protein [Burkholderiales bacterium]